MNVALNRSFAKFINLVIILNTVTLAQDRHPLDQAVTLFLEDVNVVFFTIFFLEMIIKLIGLGSKTYFKDRFNLFDFAIVLISTVDIFLYTYMDSEDATSKGAISALRAFRLLRIFKLAKSWREF